MEVDRSNLRRKRAREEEVVPEDSPMSVDSNVAHLIPYVPDSPPAAVPQPEQPENDEAMPDRCQVEVSEALCRRILVRASESGEVVAEQLVAQREVSVSTPQEQISVSEEREVRAVRLVSFGSSCDGNDPVVPQGSFALRGTQAVRRSLRWDQVSGELELDLEELERWRVVEDRMGGDSWEPGTRGPGGMTLPQPSSGPSSALPGENLEWSSRPLLPCPPSTQSSSSASLLLDAPADPSEGQSEGVDEMEKENNPSEELPVAQTQATTTTSRTGSARRQSYVRKEFWDRRLVKEFEVFKTAPSDRRHKIWLGWTKEERRWVLLASGVRSRQEQFRWKAEFQFRPRRRRAGDSDPDDDDK